MPTHMPLPWYGYICLDRTTYQRQLYIRPHAKIPHMHIMMLSSGIRKGIPAKELVANCVPLRRYVLSLYLSILGNYDMSYSLKIHGTVCV